MLFCVQLLAEVCLDWLIFGWHGDNHKHKYHAFPRTPATSYLNIKHTFRTVKNMHANSSNLISIRILQAEFCMVVVLWLSAHFDKFLRVFKIRGCLHVGCCIVCLFYFYYINRLCSESFLLNFRLNELWQISYDKQKKKNCSKLGGNIWHK